MYKKCFYHAKSFIHYGKDGTPLQCECGCETFKMEIVDISGGQVCEYRAWCVNEECELMVGYWSYGHWEPLDL